MTTPNKATPNVVMPKPQQALQGDALLSFLEQTWAMPATEPQHTLYYSWGEFDGSEKATDQLLRNFEQLRMLLFGLYEGCYLVTSPTPRDVASPWFAQCTTDNPNEFHVETGFTEESCSFITHWQHDNGDDLTTLEAHAVMSEFIQKRSVSQELSQDFFVWA